MCDAEGSGAGAAASAGWLEGDAEAAVEASAGDADIMAFNSASLTPALCRRINSLGDVLNFPEFARMAETMTDSGSFCRTILITSSLVKDFCGCCASDDAHRHAHQQPSSSDSASFRIMF